MDPIALSARERWTEPKKPAPKQKHNLTPFQRLLYANPFAHALASPVRLDRTTSTHFPTFFHLQLHLHPHPQTNQPHVLPTSLLAASQPTASPVPTPIASTPSIYTLLRHSLVQLLTRPGKGARWLAAINNRAQAKLARTSRGDIVWRDDMPEYVRGLLRAIVFRRLQWAFGKRNGGGMFRRLSTPPPPSPLANRTARAGEEEEEAEEEEEEEEAAGGDEDGVGGGHDEQEGERRRWAALPLEERLAAIPDAGAILFLRRVRSRDVREVEARVRAAAEAGDALVDQVVKIGEAARKALKEPTPPRPLGGWEAGGPRLHPAVLYAGLDYLSVRYRAKRWVGREEVEMEREIPVYDLVELLGEEKLADLLLGTRWEGEAAVVLREKEVTIGAHQALMQLQDYVIESM